MHSSICSIITASYKRILQWSIVMQMMAQMFMSDSLSGSLQHQCTFLNQRLDKGYFETRQFLWRNTLLNISSWFFMKTYREKQSKGRLKKYFIRLWPTELKSTHQPQNPKQFYKHCLCTDLTNPQQFLFPNSNKKCVSYGKTFTTLFNEYMDY